MGPSGRTSKNGQPLDLRVGTRAGGSMVLGTVVFDGDADTKLQEHHLAR